MANVSGASLGGIYDRLHDASEYPPLTAKTFADWSMEAGDIVTIQRDGKSYTSPAMNNTTVWRKKQQVSVNSTGKEKHDTVAKMSQRKFRGGSASLRATQKAFEQIITSYNEMTAGLVLASSTAHLYVDNKYTQMTSGLYLTASTAKLYTDDRYRQMSSGLELSTSTAKLYVDNRYAQMTAGLELTSSTAKLYVDNKYAQMTAGLDLTSSTAKLYTDDKYRQMSSGLELSTSTAKLYVDNKYAQMTAGLDLTSSTAKLYVDNKYAQMQAGLDLTSSTAKLYVDNKYAQMTAGLDLTSSTAKLYTDNKYTQMSSGLALSTSSAKLYVDNKYTQMSSGLELSTSTAKLYVDNKYAQMSAGLDLSTSAAILYAGSATNAATIAARINESTGEAEIILSSDKVYIGDQKSTTVINGKLNTSNLSSEISNLDYVVTKSLSAQRFSLYDSPGEGTTSVNVASTALRTAALNLVDNTYYLHLYAIDGTECVSTRDNAMSFSRATTLSGEWGSGTLTVRASPQGNNMTFGIFDLTNQDISWSDRTATLTVYANVDGGETKYDTGKRLTVTAPIQTQTYGHSWSSGTCTVTGTPSGSTTKIGIYDLRSQDVSWNDDTHTLTAKLYANKNGDESRTDTGKRLTLNITDISLWQGNTRLSGSQSIWSSTDIKAWCKVNGTWVGGDTITFSHGGTQRTLYKGYNTDDSVYYGKLYKSDGTALTGDSYYWYGCSTNFGTTASVNVYQ